MRVNKQRIHRLLFALVVLVMTSPLVVNTGCRIIVYEDGTGYDTCNSEHISRERVLGSRAGCQPSDLSFVSEAAYQNWMTWASQHIQTMAEYDRGYWERELAKIERQRYPPGQSGIVLPSTTTEGGHTGGGSKGGGGK